jgi:hypothetical protein
MSNLRDYQSLSSEEQDDIQEETDCQTEEERQELLNVLYPATPAALDEF